MFAVAAYEAFVVILLAAAAASAREKKEEEERELLEKLFGVQLTHHNRQNTCAERLRFFGMLGAERQLSVVVC